MSAATTDHGFEPTPSGAKPPLLTSGQLFAAKMATIVLLAIGAAVVAFLFHESTSNPSMTVVVKDARQGVTLIGNRATGRSVDGISFPDWSKQGWTLAGGRSDNVGHKRVATTSVYQSGGRLITLTIVSGTGAVDNGKRAGGTPVVIKSGSHTVPTTYFGFGANVLSDGAMYIFKRQVNGRTVVMTGTPISTPLYNEMKQLLVTGLDPWNGAVPGRNPNN